VVSAGIVTQDAVANISVTPPLLDNGVSYAGEAGQLEKTQYFYGGRNYCWYAGGWRGAGYYWCGYAWRRGLGWGGPIGWRGWGGGGWHGGRGGWHGGGGGHWHGGGGGWHGGGGHGGGGHGGGGGHHR
jgi:hypothetical protein